jgi:diguanylate cyclase (GGDEF)-like protein/PAS domain S-box-containing protein
LHLCLRDLYIATPLTECLLKLESAFGRLPRKYTLHMLDAPHLDCSEVHQTLETAPEPSLHELTRLASVICATPLAFVCLLNASSFRLKSKVGFSRTDLGAREALCSHAIGCTDLFIVTDLTQDTRFRESPLVSDEQIRFYAGMPLRNPDGDNVGVLCVMDRTPRDLTLDQQDALRVLGRQVMNNLVLLRKIEELKNAEAERSTTDQRFRAIFDTTFEFIGLLSPNGIILEANRTSLEAIGAKLTDVAGKHFAETPWWAHDIAKQAQLRLAIEQAAGGEFVRFDATHPLVDGTTAAIDFSISPVFNDQGDVIYLVPEGRDVTEKKAMEDALRHSDDRFRAFMNGGPVAAFMKDEEGRYTYVNEPLVKRFGIEAESWIGRTDRELFPSAFTDAWRSNDRRVLSNGVAEQFDESVIESNGEESHWTTWKFPFRDASNKPHLAAMGLDVTEKKRTESILVQSERKFRGVLKGLAEGVFLVDIATAQILEANEAFLRLVGRTDEEVTELSLFDLVNLDQQMIKNEIQLIVAYGQFKLGRRQVRHKDGRTIDVDVSVSHLAADGPGMLSVVLRDMTEEREREDRLFAYQLELEEANTKLKLLSVTDGLTGLFNRASFDKKLAEECDRAQRYGHALSLVLLDVDFFKSYNDTFGHPAGDVVLRSVAALLRESTRTADFVARYGGEEFAIVLPDTELNGALVIAERCRRVIVAASWPNRPVTISAGVASWSPVAAEPSSLVSAADQALYQSKTLGRNRVTNLCVCAPKTTNDEPENATVPIPNLKRRVTV